MGPSIPCIASVLAKELTLLKSNQLQCPRLSIVKGAVLFCCFHRDGMCINDFLSENFLSENLAYKQGQL